MTPMEGRTRRVVGVAAIAGAFVLGVVAGVIRESRGLPLPSSPVLEARQPPRSPAEIAQQRELPEEIVRAGEEGDVVVTHVVDGDTLDTTVGRVRLLGIDAPEKDDCFGSQAQTRLREVVLGREVTLASDPLQGDRDRFGRLLRFVDREGIDLSADLVSGGFARVFAEYPTTRTARYRILETEARQEGRGMWGSCDETLSDERYSPALRVT